MAGRVRKGQPGPRGCWACFSPWSQPWLRSWKHEPGFSDRTFSVRAAYCMPATPPSRCSKHFWDLGYVKRIWKEATLLVIESLLARAEERRCDRASPGRGKGLSPAGWPRWQQGQLCGGGGRPQGRAAPGGDTRPLARPAIHYPGPPCCHRNGKCCLFQNSCFHPTSKGMSWRRENAQICRKWLQLGTGNATWVRGRNCSGATPGSSAVRWVRGALLARTRKVNLFKGFTAALWPAVASEENIHRARL